MSGVYFPRMQLPDKCKNCDLVFDLRASMYCPVSGNFVGFEDTPETAKCPGIPVPDHGDLIDRDEAVRDLRMDYAYAAAKIVALQPTIIPAEDHIADVGKKDGA